MGLQTWNETLVVRVADGPTITAIGAASCIPTGSRIILPNNFFYVGRIIRVSLFGRISCVVTTPGTARFDVRTGPSGTIVAYDSGAMNLNVVAKVNVPILVEIDLTCRAVGSGTASVTSWASGGDLGSRRRRSAARSGRQRRLLAPGRRTCSWNRL
jgi:hypothetical protein